MSVQQATSASTRKVCKTLGLPRSSYYHASRPTSRQVSDHEIGEDIEAIFHDHLKRYGYRRIWHELAEIGVRCSQSRVRRIMKERGLLAIQPKSFRPQTSDGRADCPSQNLLGDAAPPRRPDECWVGDITYIRRRQGWLFLAVVMDLYSRRIVGWTLAKSMQASLVDGALRQAVESRPLTKSSLVFHSDRGSQYGSRLFRQTLRQQTIDQSMSRRANPYDNAFMESFMGTLKLELIRDGIFEDIEDARLELFEYIDGYYNNHRKHSALGYVSPAEFERLHYTKN